MENCSFFDGGYENPFLINAQSVFSLNDLKAADILFEGINQINNSFIRLSSCVFNISKNMQSLSVFKSYDFIIENCVFQTRNSSGAGLFIFQTNSSINSCKFILLNSDEGSALKFYNLEIAYVISISVKKTSFLHNHAFQQGGAVMIQGYVQASFLENEFTNNSVNSSAKLGGVGGAIYFSCLKCHDLVVSFRNNTFSNNKASRFAPNVFSQAKIDPSYLDSNKISDSNDSLNFTRNFSSFPVSVQLSAIFFNDFSPVNFSINNFENVIISGGEFNFNLTLVDFFGQRLLFDSLSSSSLKKIINDSSSTLLLGGFAKSTRGFLPFQRVRVHTKLDSPLNLNLTVEFDEKLFLPNILEKNSKNNLSFELRLYARPCLKGEIFLQTDQSCNKCSKGEYSIVDPIKYLNESKIPMKCYPCPLEASCPGGSALIPRYGYWRASENSSKIVECIARSFCLGAFENSSEIDSKNFYILIFPFFYALK
jgi:hypothetical protein